MKPKTFIFLFCLFALLPAAQAFTYTEVIDFFQGFVGSYTNFITGKASHSFSEGTHGKSSNNIIVFCLNDKDCDSIPDNVDNCPTIKNPKQEDDDLDGIGDVCDTCKTIHNLEQKLRCEELKDSDRDTIQDRYDNCPTVYNIDQSDIDGDKIGDACDFCAGKNDADGDGFLSTDCKGGKDCDDKDARIFPGAPENCDDNKDNNCKDGNNEASICADSKWADKYRKYWEDRGKITKKEPKKEDPSNKANVEAKQPTKVKEVEEHIKEILKIMISTQANVKAIANFEATPLETKEQLLSALPSMSYSIKQAQEALANIDKGDYDGEENFIHLVNRVKKLEEGMVWQESLRLALQ